jgi:hypothetical protein
VERPAGRTVALALRPHWQARLTGGSQGKGTSAPLQPSRRAQGGLAHAYGAAAVLRLPQGRAYQ